ncbi:hypothetical protein EUA71_03325 [TM7 phylum sp. oral taxon 352]|nr:hypothetical protein EUA71_03325 [TM7 phylum sp. oral taxon 352]
MKIKQKMKKKTRIILASTLALALVAFDAVSYIYTPAKNKYVVVIQLAKKGADQNEYHIIIN